MSRVETPDCRPDTLKNRSKIPFSQEKICFEPSLIFWIEITLSYNDKRQYQKYFYLGKIPFGRQFASLIQVKFVRYAMANRKVSMDAN